MLNRLYKCLLTNPLDSTPPDNVETKRRKFRALSPNLSRYEDYDLQIGIEETTDTLHLLKVGPSFQGPNGSSWSIAPSIGTVTIEPIATGGAVYIHSGVWCVKMTRLQNGKHFSEVLSPASKRQMQFGQLDPSTPFRREGHAEYDALAMIYEEAPATPTKPVEASLEDQSTPPHQ